MRLTLTALWATLLALAGCAGQPPRQATAGATPAHALSAADLAASRRCLDTLLQDHGAREHLVQVDPAGSPELMLSVLADLAPRSRAVRLVGADGNPTHLVRGHTRLQQQADETRVALDLAVLNPRDQSVLPGLASHLQAAWHDIGAGQGGWLIWREGDLALRIPPGPGDPRPQAQRALAELGTLQMVGRLARVPYWRCWGASAKLPRFGNELQDWYDQLAASQPALVGWFQQQLRLHQAYSGPVDGAVSPAFRQAVLDTRQRLGLAAEAKLTLDFYQALLLADPPAQPVVATATPAATAPEPTATALRPPASAATDGPALRISAVGEQQRFARGEVVQLKIQPSRDAHVWCYHQDENRRIRRFFPNRFHTDARVAAAAGLQLPGRMGFELAMNMAGTVETVACYATDRDVSAQLPAPVAGTDFVPLPLASLEQVRSAFHKASGGVMAAESFLMRTRNP